MHLYNFLQNRIDIWQGVEENFTKSFSIGVIRVEPSAAHSDSFSPRVLNPNGTHPIVLICEHASNAIPAKFDSLGLDKAALNSHIAWDPGALETAKKISEELNAALVCSTVSRLVYDCNRPPDAPDAMPDRSETTHIPGNKDLSSSGRDDRIANYYRPFETLISDVLDHHGSQAVLVTIHSFTPVYLGRQRDVQIGILHDEDTRLADALLDVADGYKVDRNEPYGPDDGVTHTLAHHAIPRGLLNVMIEIRNDLIATPQQCDVMASKLADWLVSSLAMLQNPDMRKAAT